jgi:hypothetical protein
MLIPLFNGAKFFDRIHHDRLIARMGEKVSDKRILRLVGIMLRSGVMINGVVTSSEEGAVQGSPLSPLLRNIVLDELDQELEKCGLEFCRFADDCNIFVKSQQAAILSLPFGLSTGRDGFDRKTSIDLYRPHRFTTAYYMLSHLHGLMLAV